MKQWCSDTFNWGGLRGVVVWGRRVVADNKWGVCAWGIHSISKTKNIESTGKPAKRVTYTVRIVLFFQRELAEHRPGFKLSMSRDFYVMCWRSLIESGWACEWSGVSYGERDSYDREDRPSFRVTKLYSPVSAAFKHRNSWYRSL